MQNLRSLRSTNIEKHFKVPHNKEPHKIKVLERTKIKYRQGWRGVGQRERKREIFPALMQEVGADSKWWSPTPSFILESWGNNTWSKTMDLGG
jgi:hypothetical protein